MCRKSFLKKRFSQKFLRNYFLVLMFLKWLLFGTSQLFCLYCDKIFVICIWGSIRFPKQLSSGTPLSSCHSIWFDSEFHPIENTTFMSGTYLKPSQTSKMKLLAKVVNASRDVFRTVFSIQNILITSKMALFTKIINDWKPLTFSTKNSILDIFWVLKMPLDSQPLTIFIKNWILDL